MQSSVDVVAGDVARVMSPQQELLGLPDTAKAKAVEARRAKAGRPPGARNRRDEEAARVAVERFGDPLLRQVAVATMDTEELAARLGCTALEALQEQRLAAQVVMPFLHSRKPLSVDLRNHKVVHLTIVDSEVGPVLEADAASTARVVDVLEYQLVSEGADGEV